MSVLTIIVKCLFIHNGDHQNFYQSTINSTSTVVRRVYAGSYPPGNLEEMTIPAPIIAKMVALIEPVLYISMMESMAGNWNFDPCNWSPVLRAPVPPKGVRDTRCVASARGFCRLLRPISRRNRRIAPPVFHGPTDTPQKVTITTGGATCVCHPCCPSLRNRLHSVILDVRFVQFKTTLEERRASSYPS